MQTWKLKRKMQDEIEQDGLKSDQHVKTAIIIAKALVLGNKITEKTATKAGAHTTFNDEGKFIEFS